ncbi:hypothetical protein ABEB36_008896 [Hypothenemus hampei]|uniref:Uncharacterized protein n=1 Tax=Hypothenemus hampei TaxID=57062 RepID=A0ABD1ENF9_HYPHA
MKIENDDSIVVSHEGKNVITLSCSAIQSYNVTEKIITCQFREDYFAQKLAIKFFGNDQVKTFLSALPPILRPTPEEDISRRLSESNYDDSGREETSSSNLTDPPSSENDD